MKFHFDIDVRPWDFFKMSMKKTYKSPVGVCNIVFTVAAVLLTAKFYSDASDIIQFLLVIMCLIFTVFQPVGVFFRAKALAAGIPKGLTLDVDDDGLLVAAGSRSERIEWKRIKALIDNKDMLILKVDSNNGYFLTNRVLGDERDVFKKYMESGLGNR